MKAGRPRKPDHIKKAQGTLKPCRVNNSPATSELLSSVPDIPEDVPDNAHGYFTHCCEYLLHNNLLTSAIIVQIVRASDMYSNYKKMKDIVDEHGPIQTTETGYTAKTGAWTVMVEAHKLLLEFEREQGLTLASSQKISVPPSQKNEDDFD